MYLFSSLNSNVDSTDSQAPCGSRASGPGTPLGGPTTPHTPSSEVTSRHPGSHTPDRFSVASPGMAPPTTPLTPQQTGQDNKPGHRYSGPSPQGISGGNSQGGPKTPVMDANRFPVPSPKSQNVCGGGSTPGSDPTSNRFGTSPLPGDGPANRFSVPPNACGQQGAAGPKMPGGIDMGDLSNTAAHMPLNPNCSTPSGLAPPMGKVFDPISSMAQMSQQLTSGTSGGSPPSSGTPTLNMGAGGAPAHNPNLMDSPGGMMGMPPVSSSPSLMGASITSPVGGGGGPRGSSPGTMAMMGGPNVRMGGPGMPRPPCSMPGGYSGANIQVKASAPNTIQYLPARPSAMPGPRGPPSLDFLPRFSSPGAPGGDKMFPSSSTPSSLCGPNAPPMSTLSMSGPCGPPMNGPGPGCSMAGPMNGPGGPMCTISGPMSSGPPGPTMSGGPTPPFGMTGGPNGTMGMCPNGPMGPGPMNSMGNPMAGPNGAIMGPNGPMSGPGGNMMGPNGPIGMNPGMIGPSGQMMGPRGGGPMLRGSSPGGMMPGPVVSPDMYSMGGPGPNMGGGPGQGGPNQMMSGSPSMYGPKGSPVPMNMGGGMAPDAAQPLPPSMGQSGNFKSSTFMAPTTADPTYAAQFHNFQQQLYATNTRPGHGPMSHMVPPVGHPGGPMGPMVSCSGGGMPPVPGPGHVGVQGYPFNPK